MICVCGNNRYFAHQKIRADVITDENGNFYSNAKDILESSVYDSEKPYGPFVCTKCGKEYDELD